MNQLLSLIKNMNVIEFCIERIEFNLEQNSAILYFVPDSSSIALVSFFLGKIYTCYNNTQNTLYISLKGD